MDYIKRKPDGYSRSQFGELFRQWQKQSKPSLSIDHKAGDKLYIDYAGKRLHTVDLHTGSIGVGKSYLACALGHQACLKGYKVLYFNLSKLLSRLKMMKADGSYLKEITRLEKQDLLILDDFGLQPIDDQSRLILMEIIEDRYDIKSTIITSQLPVGSWYEVINKKTIADAIMDRIIHNAYRFELQGESLRKRRKVSENSTIG